MRIEQIDIKEWRETLPESGFGVFHTPEALRVLDEHARGDLKLLCGFKGDRPVALLPLVVQRRPVGTAVLSPPPSMGIPHLGPLLMPASPKVRKQEKLNQEFTEAVIESQGITSTGTLFRIVCSQSYVDPRPFQWQGLDVGAAFTYVLDTRDTTSDDLFTSFSKSLRRDIRDALELDITISIENTDWARQVYDETEARYREQNRKYPMTWEYVHDITSALAAENRCRVYIARTADGEFLSGITVLYSNETAYFWQGGMRTTYEGVSINSLLHWRIIEDLVANPPRETVTQYDLMGANTERLCRYKAKFGATLVPYYVIESSGKGMDLAKKAYQLVTR